MPRHSRHVGGGNVPSLARNFATPTPPIALKLLDPESDVPWQRVVSSTGTLFRNALCSLLTQQPTGAISSRGPGTIGARRQAEALGAEGLTVQETRTGQFRVNFATDGWFPATMADAIHEGE
jgi:methylated-DNA-protein-cysteine methyltransferase-like protein